jgi:hypothetical protein
LVAADPMGASREAGIPQRSRPSNQPTGKNGRESAKIKSIFDLCAQINLVNLFYRIGSIFSLNSVKKIILKMGSKVNWAVASPPRPIVFFWSSPVQNAFSMT